jgi:hypothetical protein
MAEAPPAVAGPIDEPVGRHQLHTGEYANMRNGFFVTVSQRKFLFSFDGKARMPFKKSTGGE